MSCMRVLFVCSGNAHRSPLAEALLKRLRPDLEVDSAGVHPSIPISEEARRFVARDDTERYLKRVPEGLDGKRLEEYDLIVAMEQRHRDVVLSMCPSCEGKTVVWNIDDPYFLPPERAERVYNQIKERVAELAKSL